MVLYRHPDHSLTLRVFSLSGIAPFYPAKSAKRQRAIGPASRALVYDTHAAILNSLLGSVFLLICSLGNGELSSYPRFNTWFALFKV
jgi:hypothetical protein